MTCWSGWSSMALKAVSMRYSLRAVLVLTMLCLPAVGGTAQNSPQQQAPQENTFSDRDAAALLVQLRDALQGHSDKKLLSIFDLPRMRDGALFKQQISAFFAQTESISVHLNLAEIAVEGEKATVAVDAEMDVTPRGGLAPSRRNQRLNFVAVNTGGRWKFIDVQPRSFFSLP
jgi:hypothetical protein